MDTYVTGSTIKRLRESRTMTQGALAEKIGCEEIDHVEVVGGYMNVFLSRSCLAKNIVEAVRSNPGRWGSSSVGEGKTVCLDYSSINIAKRFHIGHLSTTMLGHSLARIYRFLGYQTVVLCPMSGDGTPQA